jgi:hypothetical protein
MLSRSLSTFQNESQNFEMSALAQDLPLEPMVPLSQAASASQA